MDFKGKKITLMGLGLLGGGVQDALFFIKRGAILTITDLRDRRELKPSIEKINRYLKNNPRSSSIKWVLGEHKEEDFKNADLILKNPGVPNNSKYLNVARDNNVPVYTSAGILFETADTKKIIGVTGTKGKSTTAGLIYEILKLKDENAYIAGLPGVSLLQYAEQAQDSWGVVELSSWQLEGITESKRSPHIAVITNIEEDHLNRHGGVKEYTEAKKLIYKYQKPTDHLVAHASLEEEIKDASGDTVLFFAEKDGIGNTETAHKENIAAALKVSDLLGVEHGAAMQAIKNFKGLPGRMEFVAEINGAKIYNDTTATNPFAAISAIKSFEGKKIAIIVGGEDKGLDYQDLARELEKIHFVALLPGTASDKIKKEISRGMAEVDNLEQALHLCMESDPEVILLSPAAASFNMFLNEFDRGEKFIQKVREIKNGKK